MSQATRILFCNCTHAQVVSPRTREHVLNKLVALGIDFAAVADLCGMSARRDPMLREIAGRDEVVIAACFPRAVKWLFHAAGAPLKDQRALVVNMREEDADQLVAALATGSPPR